MRSALFLGAGASAFAGYPTTEELMDHVRERVEKRRYEPNRDKGCQNYIASVIDNSVYSDVEKLYDGIERTINTYTNPNCKPIIGGLKDNNTGICREQIIKELKYLLSTIRDILLESFVVSSGYHESIKLMYDKTRSAMKIKGTTELRVFTTNYDLVMEEYAKQAGYEIVNGFRPHGHLRTVWDDVWKPRAERSMYMIKLHGSMSWYRDAGGHIMEIGGIQDRDIDHDVMIAPTEGMKNYGREPFPALMDHFKKEMERVDVLLAIGSSYRDEEIVSIIKDRLEDGMYLISLSPTAAEDIRRVSDTEPEDVEAGGVHLKTVGQRVILCEMEFGPATLDTVRASLEMAYEIIRNNYKNSM